MFQTYLFGSTLRAGISRQARRLHGCGSRRPLHVFSEIPQDARAFSDPIKSSKVDSPLLRNLGMKLGLVRMAECVSLRHVLTFRSFIHSGNQAEVEAGRPSRSMDYVQGLLQERENGFYGRSSLHQPQVESNADVVHMKLMRNNAFVTVTDSRGNKKFGTTSGKLAGKGGKLTRYSGEAAAEDIGRRVRQMKTRSVVVKVNGFTFFKKKKNAILSFKDGYSYSRSDMNPVVYIEDTTQKPHNGCRLPKKRRI